MPFDSKAQQRYLYANKPKGVDLTEWSEHTDFKHLPERAKKHAMSNECWATEYFKTAMATPAQMAPTQVFTKKTAPTEIIRKPTPPAADPKTAPTQTFKKADFWATEFFEKEAAKLTSEARKHLPKGDFVFPGAKRYPIEDESHARNALARSSGKSDEARVRAAVHAKYPNIGKE
jgi:hypothetical protein